VRVADFTYHLPEDLIAQEPLPDRAASRLLHLQRATGQWTDRAFRELPALLRPDDLLVFNNTRVFPARLFARRQGLRAQPVSEGNPAARGFLHGRVEVLLTKRVAPDPESCGGGRPRPPDAAERRPSSTAGEVWQALVRPGRKIDVGERLYFDNILEAEVIARGDFGERTLRFAPVPDFFAAVEQLGHIPLPPYLPRADSPSDRERYQTVFARERGSVAAPTAGLHFTTEILDQVRARGIETAEITLHVGLGTFQPLHVENVEEHRMHSESFRIPQQAAAQIEQARAAGRRIVAVGTTTVRTLEFAAAQSAAGEVAAGSGEADIFIYPGHRFRVVGALLTNFHLPQSTLLMLVSAFAGRDLTLRAYEHAVRERYRFFSYGDCMLIV
jgi:S-adenosylmethionine:tRNA ribosyltransferase-isomerase